MKRIVVTGGAGLIGSALITQLLEKDHNVICIDNFLTGSREALTPFMTHANFSLIEHDVTMPLPKIDGHIDWIFHLASPASPNHNSPISYHSLPMETMMVNTKGTHQLLDLALQHNARFIFASTSEVYGDPLEHPQKESYNGNVSTTGPRSIYDEAKRFGETLTAYYARDKHLDGRIVRIFNTYGPGMRKDDQRMLVNFVTQALENKDITIYGDGTQTRSLGYVKDTARGIIMYMEKDNLAGEIINIGSQVEHTVLEYAHMVIKLTGSKSNIVHLHDVTDDPQRRQPDISKAKLLLNWQPTTSLEQGMKEMIAYYQNTQK
ncbi:MAG: dTDP-glucose 4,6-dehydratase [Microgenomates bacterium OLB23]|nr:MAG: dTDP-glucose 4,6-dehydratase [Microgenomates bacterium OLB23]